MLLWLFEQLAGYNSSFQVVRYLTLRSLLSVLTALMIGLVLGPIMIRKLQALKYGQAVSSFAPENHAKKMGTPTMGGILILLSIGISTILWADLSNPYVWIVLGVMVVFGAVGWADDLTLPTGGRGQRISLERGVATRSKKNPGKRSHKGG